MLLRFAVSNHLSIKETQELSFIKSALKGSEEGLLSTPALPRDKVLPVAIIYGPNASGKSNLIDALMFMRHAVLSSHRQWEHDGGIPRQPFLLCDDWENSPSRFEIDFDIEGVRYNYGFVCTSSEFVEEWLYSSPVGRPKVIFERNGPNPDDVKFGASFTGKKQAIASTLRPNSLFLSAAVQSNHPLAKLVASAFQKIRSRSSLSTDATTLDLLLKDKEIDGRILSFLKEIGTGITNHQQIVVPRSEEQIRQLRSMYEALLTAVDGNENDDMRKTLFENIESDVKIQFSHKSAQGRDVFFSTSKESAGTRRLIPLLQEVINSLDQGGVCVIDEIDASLHTQVCEAIIALFTNSSTNPSGAQIIATTHDTNLFSAPNLRRDELWLVEKTLGGASEVYPLSDIKTRETDNFERGYLHGRYGAIPFAGSATELVKSL